MSLILYRTYNTFLALSIIVLTTLFWPLILLLQWHSFTREWYYSNCFSIICKLFIKSVYEVKEKLFDLINKDIQMLKKSGKMINVLEIGPGTGDNFQFYKYPVQLTTVEKNPFLKQIAHKLSIEYPLVNILDSCVANAEKMTCFEDNTFDVVCGTLIMCCIKNNAAALNEIRRVLKPNGRFYFLEGNRMQRTRPIALRLLEMIMGQFWWTCEYGCKFWINNFDEKLKSSEMTFDRHIIYRIPECPIGHELHYGCAVKV